MNGEQQGSPAKMSTLKKMPRRTIDMVFGGVMALIVLLAIFPPLYNAASRSSPSVLGLPFSVFYMILDGVLITLAVVALWYVENIRDEVEPTPIDAGRPLGQSTADTQLPTDDSGRVTR